MSGLYDSYNQYNQGYPPQQGYGSQQGYQQQYPQQSYSSYPEQSFGPPRRADSFGPPQAGGFQHGQAGGQYGAYDASNPQGHAGYYGQPQQYPQQQPQHYGGANDAFAQNQAYQAGMQQGTQPQQFNQAVEQHQFSPQSTDPNAPNYDPKAPPMTDGERGLLGAIGGGVGGHFLGKKANHGFLGTIGGAILGSLTEDFAKDKKKKHKHSSHHSQSSWGGGSGRY